MQYWKQSAITFLIFLFTVVLYYGFSEGLYLLFILPLFADGIFLTFYLSKEYERTQQEKQPLTEDTLAYVKIRRMMILIYCAIFFLVTSFLWGYFDNGFLGALKNLLYMGLLFWFFVMYVLLVPSFYDKIKNLLPENLRKALSGDWQKGYTLLFPITYGVYLLYPLETIRSALSLKLLHFPLFFVVYTFSFLSLYCIVYFYADINKKTIKQSKPVSPLIN